MQQSTFQFKDLDVEKLKFSRWLSMAAGGRFFTCFISVWFLHRTRQ